VIDCLNVSDANLWPSFLDIWLCLFEHLTPWAHFYNSVSS